MSTEKGREKEIYRVTIVGSVVNLLLLVFKFVAGVVGNSAAMVADAVHSLSDFVTDIIVLVFVRISAMPADKSHGYGHGKYETLATTIIGCVLLGVSVGILVESVGKIVDVVNGAVLPAPGVVALVAAAVSIVAKEVLYRYTMTKARKVDSEAVVANAWHHRSDAFSSVATLLGIGGAVFGGVRWRVLDPIAAVVVSLFVAKVAFNILKKSLDELMEHSLPEAVEREIHELILSVEGVSSPHHLRTRRIGSGLAIEVHIRMDGNLTLLEAHRITTIVESRLKERLGASTYVNIQTEPVK